MKAVIIGAGKIGRGLIAGICKTNGIEYCFVEKDMGLIEEFGKQPAYIASSAEKLTSDSYVYLFFHLDYLAFCLYFTMFFILRQCGRRLGSQKVHILNRKIRNRRFSFVSKTYFCL